MNGYPVCMMSLEILRGEKDLMVNYTIPGQRCPVSFLHVGAFVSVAWICLTIFSFSETQPLHSLSACEAPCLDDVFAKTYR